MGLIKKISNLHSLYELIITKAQDVSNIELHRTEWNVIIPN